jgi:cystathionine gamma-synthase
MKEDTKTSLESRIAQACHYVDEVTGGISPPLQFSTTYCRDPRYDHVGNYSYSRADNPSWEVLEKVCAELDGGAEARCFASGMAAVCAFFETVNSGEHVVAPRVMYHGSQDWLRRISQKRGIGLSLFEASNLEDLRRAVQPGKTAVVWIESPVNPTWDVIDIALAADIAHAAGAILAVDATVASPVTTRALEHGADIVFHSATKYLNAGILVTAKQDERWEDIKLVRTLTGGVLGPFEAWLLLRGMRTLFVRFDKASQSALRLARYFEGHPRLQRVLYPGLESHPGHDIAKRQMTQGFGGMLSLLVEGDAADAKSIAGKTRLFVRATSLGGVESLIEHRASVEGPLSEVPQNLLRLSIGIENCQDLINDLEQSLDAL